MCNDVISFYLIYIWSEMWMCSKYYIYIYASKKFEQRWWRHSSIQNLTISAPKKLENTEKKPKLTWIFSDVIPHDFSGCPTFHSMCFGVAIISILFIYWFWRGESRYVPGFDIGGGFLSWNFLFCTRKTSILRLVGGCLHRFLISWNWLKLIDFQELKTF